MGRKSKNKRPADDQSSAGADDGGPGTSDQAADRTKLRPVKKHKTVAPSTESSKLFDDAINAVLSQTANDSMDTCDDDVHTLTNTVTQLVQKVHDQHETITELRQQVSFLLSYLGVTSTTTTPADGASSTETAGEPSSVSPPSTSGGTQQQTVKTYASVSASRPAPLSTALKQAVVSAVYTDIHEKNRRSKNFVISGLPVAGDDKPAVEKILADDFGQTYTVLKCRRLGRPQNDRIQPLLVTMEHDSHVTYITSNARRLRQSDNETVRQSVFINPDLTRAEAFSAYQNRCERRRREAKKQPAKGPSAPPQSSSSSMPPPPAQMNSTLSSQGQAADVAPSSSSAAAAFSGRQQTIPSTSVASSSSHASAAAVVSVATTASLAVNNNTALTTPSAVAEVGLSVASNSSRQ